MSKNNTQQDITTTTCSPSQVAMCLQELINANLPAMMWGSPGLGKSDIVRQLAEKTGRQLIDLRLLLLDPTDLKGIPYYNPTTNSMEWAAPGELPPIVDEESLALEEQTLAQLKEVDMSTLSPSEAIAQRNRVESQQKRVDRTRNALKFQTAILFLDELVSAPPSVQAAAYQLVLDRKIGQYKLPEGVRIIAAGNKATDKGVVFPMPTPLANRFIHLSVEPSLDDWVNWAVANNVHPDVIGFLSVHKNKLFTMDTSSRSPEKAFATPRSWKFVSDFLWRDMDEKTCRILLEGAVGAGPAIEFVTHQRFAADLPKPEDVLTGKVKTLKTKETSAIYSLVVNMAYTLKDWENNLNSIDSRTNKKEYVAARKKLNDGISTYLHFLMSNDSVREEVCVLAAKILIQTYSIDFDVDEVDSWDEFTRRYQTYIIAS